MSRIRYWLARHVIHFGLILLPEGRCKTELYAVLGAWGRHVLDTLDAHRRGIQ